MKKVWTWIKGNKAGVGIWAATAALLFLVGCGGLRFSDWVTVKVPFEVQKAFVLPARIPLTDAERVFKAWQAAGEQFAVNIGDSWKIVGMLDGLFQLAITSGASMFPGLGALGLTAFGGLLIPGPGSGREKNKSYNKGLAVGEAIAAKAAAAIKAANA